MCGSSPLVSKKMFSENIPSNLLCQLFRKLKGPKQKLECHFSQPQGIKFEWEIQLLSQSYANMMEKHNLLGKDKFI